jgi:spermidine synthase
MTTRIPVGVFFALFTLSGFAGLIYQSIWSHYLKLFLGHAAYAQTLVLAIFMGGMAIGAWVVSRFTHRIRNLLIGYALAELLIGVLALGFHRVFLGATGWAFDSVLPALGGVGIDLFKWGLASALILPASILLGTTFPLMSAGILRAYPESSGRALSMLYFTNSFGAAIGVLASGFFLIDRLGLPGTILTAGIMNVVLALVVWAIARRMGSTPYVTPTAASGARGGPLAVAVLVLAFVTGAASFIYEVTWIRMLSQALGASTHSFEIMLAAFILAMSLGAFWFRNRIGALSNDIGWLSGLLFAKAFFAVCAVWVYGDVLRLIQWFMLATSRTDGGYLMTTLGGLLASSLVMFPTAFCAGMTLPLATHILTTRGYGEASIGRVYGANTAGCILGAIFATHVGMELAGVKGLTGIGAAMDAAVGALLLVVSGQSLRSRPALASAAAALAAIVVFSTTQLDTWRMTSGVYRHGQFIDPSDSKMLFYRDGKTATISLIDLGSTRSIRTNGKPDASIETQPGLRASPDEYTMLLAAVLPLAMKPGAESIANIGMGSGLTTHALLGSPRLKRLDTIEIERMMVEAARHFHPRNQRAYGDPRNHMHIEDAKTFFASAGRRYDVIVSEPSNPWVSGTATLFSEEFYEHIRRYLKDDGLLVQWIQAYEINFGLLSTVFAALGAHMQDYTVYRTGTDLLVVATPNGTLPPLTPEVFSYPQLREEMAFLGIRDLEDLQAMRVGGRRALEPLFRGTGFPANSDFFPILDQRAPRARFKNESATVLPGIRDDVAPVLAMIDGESRTPLARIAASGVNRPRRIENVLFGAEAIGVSLTGRADRARGISGEPLYSALLVRTLRDSCAGAQAEWVTAIRDVARLATPYLVAADVTPLFEDVRAAACWKTLDEVQRLRIELLEATNARDAARMHALGARLLESATELHPAERLDVLVTTLLGALVEGRIEEARQLRDRHLRALGAEGRRDLGLQLVLAHLAQASRK